MRIAVTYENGQIFQLLGSFFLFGLDFVRMHAGICQFFSCYARSYSSFSPDIVSSVLLKSVASEVSSTESLLPVYSA